MWPFWDGENVTLSKVGKVTSNVWGIISGHSKRRPPRLQWLRKTSRIHICPDSSHLSRHLSWVMLGDDFFAVVLKQQANLGNLAGFLNKKTLRAWWNLKKLTLISLMSRKENSLFRFQAACWYRHRYYYHWMTTKLSLFWIWITARWKKTTWQPPLLGGSSQEL